MTEKPLDLPFHGKTFNHDWDSKRLYAKRDAILGLLLDERWWTKAEIRHALGYGPEVDIGRRLREARSLGYDLQGRRAGDPKLGIWEYRLVKK